MIIDVHNHFYPERFVREIRKGQSQIQVSVDEDNNPVLHSPGDYNVLVPEHRSVEARKEVLEKEGIDMQILSFTAPGTILETPENSLKLSCLVNDEFAQIKSEHGNTFDAFATLPLNNPSAASIELERAIDQLGFKGAMIFGNVNGIPLYDDQFFQLYEIANDKQLTLMIHPTFPTGVEAMKDFMLMPLLGFAFDTTLAAAGLVFKGVLERFPDINWILGHLGGTIPYLSERLDRGFEQFPSCREFIEKPPSHYLKRFYFDTVNFDLKALNFALEYSGVDRLIAGSDYPHKIGSLDKMKQCLVNLDLAGFDKRKIIANNIQKIMGTGM